jgi:hypothetical protein
MGTVMIQANRGTTADVLPRESILGPTRRKDRPRRKINVALWGVQGLLALVFLVAGGMKLAVPPEVLATMSPLPVLFLKLIGLAEVLGALGLILPGLTRIRPDLTPLAATCLTIEMIGAAVTTVVFVGGGPAAVMPLVVGLLAAFVAYGRYRVARQPARSETGRDTSDIDPIIPGAS